MGEKEKSTYGQAKIIALQTVAQKGLFQCVGVLLAAPTARNVIAQGNALGLRHCNRT
jgi:hypothetical protein